HMALTRARIVSGPDDLKHRVESAIRRTLTEKRDPAKLAADVRDMRERIAAEKGTKDIWALKQVRGGLIDIEFIAQYLQLAHAADHPEILDTNTIGALNRLRDYGLLSAAAAEALLHAAQLLDTLAHLLRICSEHGYDAEKAPDGLKSLLASACGEPDMTRVELKLREAQAKVRDLYDELIR
ncbi:MAG: bifunctional [glutamine synthetase] adenylyltransferase/[glutamine synthetase]-adenylyl-L-tyrosine phosphorylase, partial [Alphaproteobacteria bacterium]|nr:bifunctional [glutamine synthetase] adenylyltransferase/[glutamine synthetase]-adenylyl-L-tyrosine phosphorylase [Alphaproteobacteria bacterium]